MKKKGIRLSDLQNRFPFQQNLDFYYMGISGNPEEIEQKAFYACIKNEFPEQVGYELEEVTIKDRRTGKTFTNTLEVCRLLIVATADFFDRYGKQMSKFCRMGYQKRTLDIGILWRTEQYSGLWIEMKKIGRLPETEHVKGQRKTMDALRRQGFRCEMCCGFPEALDVFLSYLGY